MAYSRFRNKFTLSVLALALFVVSGCMLDGGGSLTNLPTNETATVKLKIRLGRIDSRTQTNPDINLSKGSAIEIQNLIVTFRSNLGDILRDTVTASDVGMTTTTFLTDSVLVDVSLRALRWWKVDIETRDQNDSIIHKGAAGPFASKGGQTMDLTIPLLNSRYLLYQARYTLPAAIYSGTATDSTSQKIYFHKLTLQIDGDTVRDSSSFSSDIFGRGTRFISADTSKLKGAAGKFFFKPNGTGSDTATHVQSYEYVKVGTHDFKISAYGYLEGDSVSRQPRLLYQGSSTITVLQNGTTEEKSVTLEWMGPGSKKNGDTTSGPGSNNWNGISMTVKLGRVKTGGVIVGVLGEEAL